MCFAVTFQSHVRILFAKATESITVPRGGQRPSDTRQLSLTSASLRATPAVPRYQGDPVSSCTDLNVTTPSAARPSYFSTWRVVFLKGGGYFGFGLGFFPPSSPPLPDVAAEERCLPRCLERRGSAACRHTCTRRSYQPLQAGRQPLLGFLFLIGTHPPEGHHISFITRSHLRDVCHKFTGFPTASFKLTLPRQPRPCRVPCKASSPPSACCESPGLQ